MEGKVEIMKKRCAAFFLFVLLILGTVVPVCAEAVQEYPETESGSITSDQELYSEQGYTEEDTDLVFTEKESDPELTEEDSRKMNPAWSFQKRTPAWNMRKYQNRPFLQQQTEPTGTTQRSWTTGPTAITDLLSLWTSGMESSQGSTVRGTRTMTGA